MVATVREVVEAPVVQREVASDLLPNAAFAASLGVELDLRDARLGIGIEGCHFLVATAGWFGGQ